MSTKRLFVSISLPSTVTKLLTEINPQKEGVRWLTPDQMHLTLSFFGNVSNPTEEILKTKLIDFEWRPFFLPICGLGKFPSKGAPDILWVGVGSGHPHLFQLHKRVQEAALGAGLHLELRPFHPHVTIARCRSVSLESIRPFLKKHETFDAGMIHVESFCLNSSRLTAEGPFYTCELLVRP